jgi:hypothetical protein
MAASTQALITLGSPLAQPAHLTYLSNLIKDTELATVHATMF